MLSIEKLRVNCIIGVHPYERKTPQPVLISIDIALSSQQAAQTEKLDQTIDYDILVADTIKLTQEGQFQLIETLAERIAELVLSHPLAIETTVTIQKPNAIEHADASAVCISRRRRTHE